MQKRTLPSFFLINTGGDAHAEADGRITPDLSKEFKCSFSSASNPKGVLRIFCLIGFASPVLMECLIAENRPKSVTFSEKTLMYSVRTQAK